MTYVLEWRGCARQRSYLPALRRCTRVRRKSLRCFFLAIRLRRFLTTEPIGQLPCRGAPAVNRVGHEVFVGDRREGPNGERVDTVVPRRGANPSRGRVNVPPH